MRNEITVCALVVLLGVSTVSVAGIADRPATVAEPVLQADGNVTQNSTVGPVQTYNGQIAVEDLQAQVEGTLAGASEVVSVFIGPSGATATRRVGVGQNGTFRADVLLEGTDRRLTVGTVNTLVLAPGRDGLFGTSESAPNSSRDLLDFVADLDGQRLTQAQLTLRLRRATVDAPGSDDLIIASTFQLAPASTRITAITAGANQSSQQFEPNTSVVVRGVTNRRPDQNAVDVVLRGGPNGQTLTSTIVEEWNNSGVWQAALQIPGDAASGTYTMAVDDGQGSDTVQVTVGDVQAQPTTTVTKGTTTDAAGETTTTTTATTTEAMVTTDAPTTEAMVTTDAPTTTGDGLDGFSPLIAVAGVLGALALVLTRRSGPR